MYLKPEAEGTMRRVGVAEEELGGAAGVVVVGIVLVVVVVIVEVSVAAVEGEDAVELDMLEEGVAVVGDRTDELAVPDCA